MSSFAIQERAIGQFPLSIATSLALEGLFGILEDNPQAPKDSPINNFDGLSINVRTLIRNIYQAMPPATARTLLANDYLIAVEEEIHIIKQIMLDRSPPGFYLSFYALTFEGFYQRYKHANTKGVNTEFQKMYDTIEYEVTKGIITHSEAFLEANHDIDDFEPRIAHRGKMLMLTHYPLDLLNSHHKNIALLESHTGKVKTKAQFHTKLKTAPDNIPFDIMTIQFYGDSGGMFKPFEIKVRKVLNAIAEKNKWNTTTTEERIKFGVRNAGEPYLYELINNLYKA